MHVQREKPLPRFCWLPIPKLKPGQMATAWPTTAERITATVEYFIIGDEGS